MDELDLAGMSGLLADAQVPTVHGNEAHAPAFESAANRGIAGGYPDLPNPLDPTSVICADNVPRRRPVGVIEDSDFLSQASIYMSAPWFGVAINSGTDAAGTGSTTHPGISRASSSTSADSGYRFSLNNLAMLIAGSCQTICWFRPLTLAGTTIRIGWQDGTGITAPVDGVYVYMDPATGIMTGRTMANSAGSITGTGYQLVTNTWYAVKILANANATRIDYYLYDDAGALLWTDNLTTNIPTTAGRETGHGIVTTNSGTTAVTLMDVDYIELYIPDRRPQV
jgi:hypothetical protein